MRVFISWSGQNSKKLGETLRDWIPSVLQLVRPYFTPSDIEKGTRWSTEIAAELSKSKIGILCITRDNIHSDWILFEAGALSKSLEKTHVCPVLFGVNNTDLAGPLKQFQATEFDKSDIRRLLSVINNEIGENKLPSRTLDTVFEKWWPDLEEKIDQILSEAGDTEEPIRSERELLEEILQLTRRVESRRIERPKIAPKTIMDLLRIYVTLHDSQVEQKGGYQYTLDNLKKMHRPVSYIVRTYRGKNKELDEWLIRFNDLSYLMRPPEEEDDDLPF